MGPDLLASLKKSLFFDAGPGVSVAFFALVLCSVGVTGFSTYLSNNTMQIPVVDLKLDPSLFPDDPFGQAARNYPSFVWDLVALLARRFPLARVLFALWLIERALIIWSAGQLAGALSNRSALAITAAMSLFALGPLPLLAHGTIISSEFEQTGLSIALIMLAAAAFIERRPFRTALWLSLVALLNIMYCAFAVTYIAAALLADRELRCGWRRTAAAMLVLAPLAAAALFNALPGATAAAIDTQLWLRATRFRMFLHLYPLAWEPREFLGFGLHVVLVPAALWTLRSPASRLRNLSVGWALTALCWLALAFIAAYLLRLPLLLTAHPARALDVWCCLGSLALAAGLPRSFEAGRTRGRLALLAFLAAAYLLVPTTGALLPVCALLIAGEGLWGRLLKSSGTGRFAALLVALALAASIQAVVERRKAGGNYLVIRPPRAISAIAEWARDNTPKDATFLVDPIWEQFRPLSQRPVFVTWKDGSTIMWNRGFVTPWTERLAELGLDIRQREDYGLHADRELHELYLALDDTRAGRLACRYGVDYWVLQSDKVTSFPVIGGTPRYKVARLSCPDDAR